MLGLVGKGHYFGFYTRAIARTDALNLPVVKGRIRKPLTQLVVRALVCIYNMAVPLLKLAHHIRQVRELVIVILKLLHGSSAPVNAPTVDSHRCSGFHPVGTESQRLQLPGKTYACRLGNSASGHLNPAYVHKSV